MMRLDRVNGDHEVITKAGVSQEGEIFGVMFTHTAVEGDEPQSQNNEGNEQIDRQHRIEFDDGATRLMRNKIRPEPLRSRPDKTEPGLNRGSEVRLGGRQFV